MPMDYSKSKGASLMKDIQKKSVEQAGGLVAINIPLDQLDENPENALIFNMEGIEMLADGIKRDGFLGSIDVFKKPDGRYEISSGHRRFRAMRLLGEKTIPCMVNPFPKSEKERVIKLISSNIRSRSMKPMDWARALDKYMEVTKKEKEENNLKGDVRAMTAEYFQMASSNVGRYLALLKLRPELQKLADNPEYSFSAFATASTLTEDEQMELYDKMMSEVDRLPDNGGTKALSRTRIVQMINDIKDRKEPDPSKRKNAGNFVSAAVEEAVAYEDVDPGDFDADSGSAPHNPECNGGSSSGSGSGVNPFSNVDENGRRREGYYTEFKNGNPLVDGKLNGTIEGYWMPDNKNKELLPESSGDMNEDVAGEAEEGGILESAVSEIEKLANADIDTELREVVRAKVARIEEAVALLKKKYVL